MEFSQEEIKKIYNDINKVFPKGMRPLKDIARIQLEEGEYSAMAYDNRKSFVVGFGIDGFYGHQNLVRVTRYDDFYSLSFDSEFRIYADLRADSRESLLKFVEFIKYQRFGFLYLNVEGITVFTSKSKFENSIDHREYSDTSDLLDHLFSVSTNQYVESKNFQEWIESDYIKPGRLEEPYTLRYLLEASLEEESNRYLKTEEKYRNKIINDLEDAMSEVLIVKPENIQVNDIKRLYVISNKEIPPILMSGSVNMDPKDIGYLSSVGINPSICIYVNMYPEFIELILRNSTEESYSV